MNVLSSISLVFVLLVGLDLGLPVDAIFCQAVNGVYRERPNDPGATESPASVDLSYHYDLEISPNVVQQIDLDPMQVAETLQHRLADALVFTLFDDCRVDPNDQMLSQVNLIQIAVQVYAVADSHGLYEAQIQAVGDTAVGDRETVLAQQRLENAVRMTVTQHHVARFSIQEGAIMTLRLPQDPIPTVPLDQDDRMREQEPSSVSKNRPPRHVTPILTVLGACATAMVLALAVLQRQRNATDKNNTSPRHVHFTLPGEEDDDVELACNSMATCKPTSKLISHHASCDPTETETEVSESSSGGADHEEPW